MVGRIPREDHVTFVVEEETQGQGIKLSREGSVEMKTRRCSWSSKREGRARRR